MKYGIGHTMYFLGIGGIGMSALARYYKYHGVNVFGYDKTATQLTRSLEKENIHIHYHEDIDLLPEKIDLAVYTPAIPATNRELQWIKSQNFPLIKRAELLGQLSKEHFTIAVAGTHGKTTITSMIAHILFSAGKNICAFIGGIASNFQSNLVLSDRPDYFIVEADEYDKSFLQLQPDIAVISSLDADHLDIYQSKEKMLKTYTQFAATTVAKGNLFLKSGISLINELRHTTYGFGADSAITAKNIRIFEGKFEFDLFKNDDFCKVNMQIGGRHNIENALAAASVASICGISLAESGRHLSTYKGVWRRFEIHLTNEKITYIDDYAHHPEELKACISAAKELFPSKKITGIFQPHLYSRTKDFMDEFAASLGTLDQLILLEIYPARELPIEGVSSAILLDKIPLENKKLTSKEDLIPMLESLKPEILLTLGAGDIDQFVEPIKEMLATW